MAIWIIKPHMMAISIFETPDVTRPTVYVKIKATKPVSYYLMDSENYIKMESGSKNYSAFLKQGVQVKHEASHRLPKNGRWVIIIVNSNETIVDISCKVLFKRDEYTS